MATLTKEDVQDYLEGYGFDETALATLLQQLEENRYTLEAWKERSKSQWKEELIALTGSASGFSDIYNYLHPRKQGNDYLQAGIEDIDHLIGKVFSVSINQSKLMNKYLTPVGSSPTTPVENSQSAIDLSIIGLELEQRMFTQNTTTQPCIILDVQRDYDWTDFESAPPITIVLITEFSGKPLSEVMVEDEFKRIVPIYPTPVPTGIANAIRTIPEWNSHPKRIIPSYVLCIPIKVFPPNLDKLDDTVQLDKENLEKLKLHIMFLGGVVANADFEDLDEDDSDDDDDICEFVKRAVSWDDISL